VAQQDAEGFKSSYGVSVGALSAYPAGSGAELQPKSKLNLVHFNSKIRNLVATKLMLYRKNVDANASMASL
jgi:hypothetical protein